MNQTKLSQSAHLPERLHNCLYIWSYIKQVNHADVPELLRMVALEELASFLLDNAPALEV